MQKHLIALDLDGTTLNNDSKLSELTIKTLKKLQNLGHLVCIATGRPYHASVQYYLELGLTSPIITDNGGNIREPHNSSFSTVIDGIPVRDAHKLFGFSKPYLESAFYSFGDLVYSYKYLDRLHNIFMGSQNAKVIHGDFLDFNHAPTGMIYLINASFKTDFENFLKTELIDTCQFRVWGADTKHVIYEIYKKGSSKLSAINWVANHYQIKKENIIAFGDGLNDIEMISGVHLGIAMPNGTMEVKNVSKEIAAFDNDQDGVAKYLINYFNL